MLTTSQKARNFAMPAEAAIQNHLKILDSRLRGNDKKTQSPVIPAKAGIQTNVNQCKD